MSDTVYTAIATSTGDGRAGGRTVSDDGLIDLTLAIPPGDGWTGWGDESRATLRCRLGVLLPFGDEGCGRRAQDQHH